MALDSKQKYDLKRFLKQLEGYRGRHTELVTVYIPEGYDMNKIIQHLSQEQGTATNIKSASTRKNVIDALERMVQHLRVIGRTPPNGLAVFSGNVAEQEGKFDFRVWSLEPPTPLKTRIYRCDKAFQLDIIREMLDDLSVYGLIVMDRREGDIAILKGKSIIPITSAKSNVPGKTRAGGQSSMRFHRLREDAAKEFYKKLGMMAKEEFLGKKDIKGIIIGGPGPTKYDFVDGDFITADVKKKIIGIKDLSYTGEFGLQELVDKSDDVLANEEIMDEKKVLQRFFGLLATKEGMVSYGLSEVKNSLEMGAVDILLISEQLDEATAEELERIAERLGSTVKIISIETREGVQLKDLGKVAAILRYEMKSY